MADEVRLMGDAESARRAGLSVASVWRKTKAGEFPTPIRIGRRTLWRSDEVTEWIERETAASRAESHSAKKARVPTNGGRRPRRDQSSVHPASQKADDLPAMTSGPEMTP